MSHFSIHLMASRGDLRGALARTLVPLAGAGLCVYFALNMLMGERGLLASIRLEREIAEARMVLDGLEHERVVLENRVMRLRDGSLDPDLLAERAGHMLHYVGPNEVVVPLGPVE